MVYYRDDLDWVEQAPETRFRGPYEDYGWERGQSVLPEFRDPSVHDHRPGERSRYARHEGGHNRNFPARYQQSHRFSQQDYYDEPQLRGPYRYGWEDDYTEPYRRRPDWAGSYRRAGGFGGYEDWMTPGPYTGRGPRGYRRSDERIMEEVCQYLTQHGQIDASEVEVDINAGEVTLKGTVDSRWAKRSIEDIAASVSGVSDVHNQLRVSEPYQARPISRSTAAQGNQKRESGLPGGGQGRVDEVKGSGVYPASGPLPSGEAEVQGMASWGQGERGAAGYEDHGESEIWFTEEERAEQETPGTPTGQWQIQAGMEVVGSNGDRVGRVKEVRSTDFLVDRPLARDVYIPFEACQTISDQIVLAVPADEVNNQGWANPGPMETRPSVTID